MFAMSEKKVTFVPVSLDPIPSELNKATPPVEHPPALFTIRKGKVAVDFYPGVDEHLIHLVMKELRFQ